MAPINDCLKSGEFRWSNNVTKVFQEIKKRWWKHLSCVYWIFQVFEVVCDASEVDIGGVLS